MNTLKDAAQAAIDVQNACNLSGVVHSFSKAMTILRAHPECTGTDWARRHPISVLFATQVAHLADLSVNVEKYNEHYEACERIAKGEPATRFFIRKSSRDGGPYTGPACERAGVTPGRIYDSKSEAETDARLLTAYNPVGFDVVEHTL